VLDGLVTRSGRLHRDGAYASDEGLSLAIAEGPVARVVGYTVAELRTHRGDDSWL
jgi:hypothetical protein